MTDSAFSKKKYFQYFVNTMYMSTLLDFYKHNFCFTKTCDEIS